MNFSNFSLSFFLNVEDFLSLSTGFSVGSTFSIILTLRSLQTGNNSKEN
jgi:hypothetical protein